MKSKLYVVLKHEFLKEIRSKGFIILTLIAPLILVALGLLPVLISSLNTSDIQKIAVIDESGHFAAQLVTNDKAEENIRFEFVGAQSSSTMDSLKALVGEKKLAGYVRIPATIVDLNSPKILVGIRNTSDFSARREISDALKNALVNKRLADRGVSTALIDSLNADDALEILKVTSERETEDSGVGFAAGYITGFILYISMLLHGSFMMQSVVEEKSTRVIELIVSSVNPRDFMFGKIFGVCLAGMLQISVWALIFAALSFLALPAIAVSIGPSLAEIVTPESLVYFVLYFAGGFLIYSTLYATVGAMVEQVSDAQGLAFPITFLVVIAIISMSSVIENPSSTTSFVLSLIPFFSPILMMGRIYSETPPFWQIALSFVLMGTTFYAISSFASKIYRTGVLMYGKKFTFKEALRWVRYS